MILDARDAGVYIYTEYVYGTSKSTCIHIHWKMEGAKNRQNAEKEAAN